MCPLDNSLVPSPEEFCLTKQIWHRPIHGQNVIWKTHRWKWIYDAGQRTLSPYLYMTDHYIRSLLAMVSFSLAKVQCHLNSGCFLVEVFFCQSRLFFPVSRQCNAVTSCFQVSLPSHAPSKICFTSLILERMQSWHVSTHFKGMLYIPLPRKDHWWPFSYHQPFVDTIFPPNIFQAVPSDGFWKK